MGSMGCRIQVFLDQHFLRRCWMPGLVTNSLLLKMAIEIVDFPIKHGDFP